MEINIEGFKFTKIVHLSKVFRMGLASVMYEVKREAKRLDKGPPEITDMELQTLVDRMWEKRKPDNDEVAHLRVKCVYLEEKIKQLSSMLKEVQESFGEIVTDKENPKVNDLYFRVINVLAKTTAD